METRISILMVPWLAHGHVTPYFELAKLLAAKNFLIFFCSTPATLLSLKPHLAGKLAGAIELIELHLPSSPELPSHRHTTNGLPPHLMAPLKRAFDMAAPAFSAILRRWNPDLVLYDFLQPWAPVLAQAAGIPAAIFNCTGALMVSMCMYQLKRPENNFPDFFSLFPEIRLSKYEIEQLKNLYRSPVSDSKDQERISGCFERSDDIVLLKTFREIEGKYIDFLSCLLGKKVVPVGPLVQEPAEDSSSEAIDQWLSEKERSSVVLVSFGSEFYLSKEQMAEMAHGLELSGANFIWVVRFCVGDRVGVEEALPEGFVERVGERGMVVENWAPQARILSHRSAGGFVSHCGWSSVMESIKFGVPIIAVPMHLDQPCNSRLVEHLGVGIVVEREIEHGYIGRKEVAKVIRDVLVEKRGEKVKEKMRELTNIMKRKDNREIDIVIKELVKLCKKNTNNSDSEYQIVDDNHCYKV